MDMELLLSSVYIFPPLDEHLVEWIMACFSCHNTDSFSFKDQEDKNGTFSWHVCFKRLLFLPDLVSVLIIWIACLS